MIYETNQYRAEYDPQKNRINISVFGQWDQSSEIAAIDAAFDALIAEVKPGFTVLMDVRSLSGSSPELEAFQQLIQGKILKAGLSRRAEVFQSSIISNLSIAPKAMASGLDVHSHQLFSDIHEAESWLDEIEVVT